MIVFVTLPVGLYAEGRRLLTGQLSVHITREGRVSQKKIGVLFSEHRDPQSIPDFLSINNLHVFFCISHMDPPKKNCGCSRDGSSESVQMEMGTWKNWGENGEGLHGPDPPPTSPHVLNLH